MWSLKYNRRIETLLSLLSSKMVRKQHSVMILFIATIFLGILLRGGAALIECHCGTPERGIAICAVVSVLGTLIVVMIKNEVDRNHHKDNNNKGYELALSPAPSYFRGRGQLEKSGMDYGRRLVEESSKSQSYAPERAPLDAKSFKVEEITQKLVVMLRKDPKDIRQFMRKTYCPAK